MSAIVMPTVAPPDRDRVAVVEVALFSTAMLVLIWEPWKLVSIVAGLERPLEVGTALVLVATLGFSLWRSRPGLHGLGLSPSAFGHGWAVLAAATLGGCVLLLAVGLIFGEPSSALLTWSRFRGYLLGVVGQQLALQGLLVNRLHAWGGARCAIVGASVVFAVLHAPNVLLMIITFIAALFWTRHFLVHHNLPALVASQLVVGTAAMAFLGEGPLLHLRVGLAALRMYMD